MCSFDGDSKWQELLSTLFQVPIWQCTIEKNNHNIVLNSVSLPTSSNYLQATVIYYIKLI